MAKQNEHNHDWNFSSIRETAAIASLAVGVSTLYGLTLAFIFTPIFFAEAIAYGIYRTAVPYYHARFPKKRQKSIDKLIKKDAIKPVTGQEINHVAQSATTKLERSEAPKIYTVSDDMLLKLKGFPWSMRKTLKKLFLNKLVKKTAHKYFSATPDGKVFFTTQKALDHGYTEKELEFAFLREIPHKKTHTTPQLWRSLSHFVKTVGAMLFLDSFTKIWITAVGFTLPVALTTGASVYSALGWLAGLSAATIAGVSYVCRYSEQRHDKNALYITQDFNSAVSFLEKEHNGKVPTKKASLLTEIFRSNTSHVRRVSALRKSWQKVASHLNIKIPDQKAIADTAKLDAVTRQRPNMRPFYYL